MTTDVFIVRLGNKRIVYIRTETGRFYDITGCKPVSDNRFGLNYNGILRNAKQVTVELVADQHRPPKPEPPYPQRLNATRYH